MTLRIHMKTALLGACFAIGLGGVATVSAQPAEELDVSTLESFDRTVSEVGNALSGSKQERFALALTVLSFMNTQEMANKLQSLRENGATDADIEAVQTDLFLEAFESLDGLNAEEVIDEGKALANDEGMTLDEFGNMVDQRMLQR